MFAGGAKGTRRDYQGTSPEESDQLSLAASLGRRVLAHRDRCAMSQEEYAKRAGIGRTRLSQIEGGKVWPSRRIRAKLASFMGVSPESLWHDENANGSHIDRRRSPEYAAESKQSSILRSLPITRGV